MDAEPTLTEARPDRMLWEGHDTLQKKDWIRSQITREGALSMFVTFPPLPARFRNDVPAIVNWIKESIPCPVGGYANSPREIVDRVYEELRRQSVPLAVSTAAIDTVFGPPHGTPARFSGQRQHASIGPAAAYARPGHPATLGMWEHKFKIAQLNNNLEQINDILQVILELLYHAAGGQRKEFERVSRDIRAHARTIAAHVQHLTAEELRRLRSAPTPSDFPRLRVNPRRGQQARAARRRGR